MSIGHLAEVLDINPHPRLENRAIFDEISGLLKLALLKLLNPVAEILVWEGGDRPPPPPPPPPPTFTENDEFSEILT
jgi:hypothetical protein